MAYLINGVAWRYWTVLNRTTHTCERHLLVSITRIARYVFGQSHLYVVLTVVLQEVCLSERVFTFALPLLPLCGDVCDD